MENIARKSEFYPREITANTPMYFLLEVTANGLVSRSNRYYMCPRKAIKKSKILCSIL